MDRELMAMWGATLVALLEAVALLKGVDGALFGTAVAIISGLCGHQVGKRSRGRHR
jgi:hypothetical protein